MCRFQRRNYSFLFIFMCAIAFLASCGGETTTKQAKEEKQPDAAITADTLVYTMSHLHLESEKTVDLGDSVDTTYFDVSYPVFHDEGLNSFVMSILLSPDDAGKTYPTIEEEGQAFIDDFDTNIQDDPFPRPWFYQKDLTILHRTKSYIAFDFSFSQYTGGAHGNYGTLYANYSPQKQDTLSLEDIVQAQKLPSLLQTAEGLFRRQEQLGKKQSLDDEYFFEDGKFALNNNFVLNEEGILFLYNVYEIKPYSSGITKLHIPYKELEGLLTDLGVQLKEELIKD